MENMFHLHKRIIRQTIIHLFLRYEQVFRKAVGQMFVWFTGLAISNSLLSICNIKRIKVKIEILELELLKHERKG